MFYRGKTDMREDLQYLFEEESIELDGNVDYIGVMTDLIKTNISRELPPSGKSGISEWAQNSDGTETIDFKVYWENDDLTDTHRPIYEISRITKYRSFDEEDYVELILHRTYTVDPEQHDTWYELEWEEEQVNGEGITSPLPVSNEVFEHEADDMAEFDAYGKSMTTEELLDLIHAVESLDT